MVEEVHDELEFVHRLEVRKLWLVTSLDQRVECRFDECARAPAQDGLLPEQVGFSLLEEGCLEDACPCATDALGIRECVLTCMT